MYKKILSVLIVSALLLSGLILVVSGQSVARTSSDIEFKPVDAGTDAKIVSMDVTSDGDGFASSSASKAAVGTQRTYLALNTYSGNLNLMSVTLRGENDKCEVWVADNRNFPASDPLNRNSDPANLEITDAQVAMILDEFANNIYTTEAQYFGEPYSKTGSETVTVGTSSFDGFPTDDGQKTMIMILNIRDGSYYDPNTYTTYVVGFFSSGIDDLYNRNIIHLDCWKWWQRTGAQPDYPQYSYLYEATVAHEYQHLLHHDMDPAESSWINEGCSMYAEVLCGYGASYSHINSFLYYPDNSLTVWGDQGDNAILGDYGAATMFMIYLNDKYGGSKTISALAHCQLQDIDSVTYTLRKMGYRTTFNEVFKNWRMANLLMSDSPSSMFGYKSLDYDETVPVWTYAYEPSWGLVSRSDVAYVMGYGIDAYGTDYFVLSGAAWAELKKSQYKFVFDGQDSKLSGWQAKNVDGVDFMWSGMGDMKDYWLQSDAIALSAGEHTFSFDSWFNIETNWDAGIVQYSTDGVNWITLANDYTTSESQTDVQEIIDALPGLTGYSGDIITLEYTLDLAEASNVYLRLRYMTDEATNGASEAPLDALVGWLATNFKVDGTAVAMPNSNSAAEDIDYLVTFYGEVVGTKTLVKIRDLTLKDKDETGNIPMSTFNGFNYLIVIVSPTNGPCDYQFGVVSK